MATQPISFEQRRALKKMLTWRLVFCSIALIAVIFIAYLVVEYSEDLDQDVFLPLVIGLIILIAAFYFIFTRGLRNDLYSDKLEMVEWRLDEMQAFETDDPGIGKDGWSSPYIKYRLVSGDSHFSVSKDLYESLEVGDIFYVPTTINSKIEFDPVKNINEKA